MDEKGSKQVDVLDVLSCGSLAGVEVVQSDQRLWIHSAADITPGPLSHGPGAFAHAFTAGTKDALEAFAG
jgi:hypothetical protein